MNNRPAITLRVTLGVFLIAAAVVAWTAAGVARDLSQRHERISTLRDDSAGARDLSGALLGRLAGALDADFLRHEAARDYWRGRYDAVISLAQASGANQSVEIMLMAANAKLRVSQREAAGRAIAVEVLETAMQNYASVLRNGGVDRDAAFNFEYLARLRDAAMRAKPIGKPATGQSASITSGSPSATGRPPQTPAEGLPLGPTIHGRQGTHPPSTKGEEFEVITPMDFGDRETQPEPTPGVKLPRKG